MTTYEHAMLGIDGALALGLHRRHGWQIVALAGLAAVLPDFDGLTILLGPNLYAEAHRLWGHNLLVAGLVAAVASIVVYQTDVLTKTQKWLARRWKALPDSSPPPAHRWSELLLWVVVGVVAAYSHLLMDIFFSGGRQLQTWGVPVLWPFVSTTWAYPLVPWGDIGVTVIFAVSMFAMLRWQEWIRTIATGTLIAVSAYMVACGTYYRLGG
jgi:membrane-bound metal-dependent hydrolase YbcI (DUF457 family)